MPTLSGSGKRPLSSLQVDVFLLCLHNTRDRALSSISSYKDANLKGSSPYCITIRDKQDKHKRGKTKEYKIIVWEKNIDKFLWMFRWESVFRKLFLEYVVSYIEYTQQPCSLFSKVESSQNERATINHCRIGHPKGSPCHSAWSHWVLLKNRGFPSSSDGKASACNVGDHGSIPRLGRSPGEGNSNPLQYSCLENSMDRGARWATVHGVTRSQAQLSITGTWKGGFLCT